MPSGRWAVQFEWFQKATPPYCCTSSKTATKSTSKRGVEEEGVDVAGRHRARHPRAPDDDEVVLFGSPLGEVVGAVAVGVEDVVPVRLVLDLKCRAPDHAPNIEEVRLSRLV